ncbi:flagellar motor switch protein FliN [Polymorphobacter fuscus]|uniref:Flagellar motor switch protein FliN n=1 Tax=Sandarakinorhabdus fusca TaxID=1439888 RepID=A0A7C9KWC4_9SPHN|nr:flagellar motor switch protein FliN [Polymorphobacter fuscus]KAB7648333.1 flagellar motor switch protein FliN [Polymorphobacter fuscus]MQT15846.1 flagellar motor switch protein FliN [Polymorphobacter fuscus]NJC07881.1 flagellar motor switch protein FliN/FliY [Polymorphobacter fuscus]
MNAMTPGAMTGAPMDSATPDLGAFGAISVRLSVEVGAVRMSLREVLALQVGSVHALDRRVDQPVDVLINDRLIARGEIVSIGDRFGVKLTEIVAGGLA